MTCGAAAELKEWRLSVAAELTEIILAAAAKPASSAHDERSWQQEACCVSASSAFCGPFSR